MNDRRALLEGAFRWAVTCAGFASAGAVLLILAFLVAESFGLFISQAPGEPGYPVSSFLTETRWLPIKNPPVFGLVPLALGSIVVTAGALVLAVPLGLAAATFLAEVAPGWLREVLKPTIELLAAIPSVVIGFVGLSVVAPAVKSLFHTQSGLTALTGSIALAIMSIPTIVTIAEDALAAVPMSYRDASLALGANRWQTTWRVVVPAAAPGLLAAVILGAGRVLGETMAVLMVTGNAANITMDPRESVRTITATIAQEMGETARGSDHYHALFALGAVLYLVTLATNGLASSFLERARRRMSGVR
jgi:phosphate transport system permease protein